MKIDEDTLLNLGLPALEEMEGIRGFGVDVLHNREDVQDVLFGEGRLVAAIKVVLLYQDLQGKHKGKPRHYRPD